MKPPQTLGKYRLMETLGSGGFATVYKAENMNLGNEVALKVMNPHLFQDEPTVARFKQEARFSVQLDHPNIVRVLDLEEANGQMFIVMEYVAGVSLSRLLASNGLLPLEQVVAIMKQIAAALDHAHSRRLVHRDIKPSNVLVRPDGVVKLTDFGIVKAVEGTKITQTGTTIGTPAYMSPEQTVGTPVDHRSDLYSLGVVLYEMITGKVPFDGDTPVAIGYKHVHEPPPLASTLHPRAKGRLETILNQALAKKPEDRFQSGAEMVQVLAGAVQELEENTFTTAYRQAVDLLKKRQYGEALSELEALEAMHPAYRDVPTLIEKARQGTRLRELYDEAAGLFARGRELAQQINTTDPRFADPAHILTPQHTGPTPSQPTSLTSLLSRLAEWLLLIGGTFVITSYSGYWRVGNRWTTGFASLWHETGPLVGSNRMGEWIPGYVWLPLLGLVILGLVLLGRLALPRLSTAWSLLSGALATIVLVLSLINLGSYFNDTSTGYFAMITGLVLLCLATTILPLGAYLRKRRT